MSFDPLHWGENLKKGFEKMQDDFNNFFNIPKKTESAASNNTPQITPKNETGGKISQSPKTSNTSDAPNFNVEKSIVVKSGAGQDNWNIFMTSAQENSRKMQEQWDTNYKNFQEKLKKSSDTVKTQLTQANTNMQTMFTNQQQQMKAFFSKVEQDMQTKNDQNRDKFLQSVGTMTSGWNQFMHKQQNQLEHTMGQWNKLAWQGQMKFICWLIPLLVLVVVIFAVLKPFLSYMP